MIINMIRNLILLTLTLPTMAIAMDLGGYYITAKGGLSKSMDTGGTNYTNGWGNTYYLENTDLGTGYAYGLSFGKVVTDNFRFEPGQPHLNYFLN